MILFSYFCEHVRNFIFLLNLLLFSLESLFRKFWFDLVALILLIFKSEVTSISTVIASFFIYIFLSVHTHHTHTPPASTSFIYFKVVKPFVVKDVSYS